MLSVYCIIAVQLAAAAVYRAPDGARGSGRRPSGGARSPAASPAALVFLQNLARRRPTGAAAERHARHATER